MRKPSFVVSKFRVLETVSSVALVAAGSLFVSTPVFAQAAPTVTGTAGCVVRPTGSSGSASVGQVGTLNNQQTLQDGTIITTAQVSNCAPSNFATATEVNTALSAINTTATGAATSAATAQATANGAQTTAAGAATAAATAQTSANQAQTTATGAQTSANTANTVATTALNNAATAQTTANNAVSYMLFNGTPVAQVDLTKNAQLPAGTTGVGLTGVNAGTLSATSTDAVNGAQLNATNQAVSALATQVGNAAGNLVYNGTGTPGVVVAPSASGSGAVAAGGGGTVAGGAYSTALGYNAQASTQSAVAIGQNASASGGTGAVSIGAGNQAVGAGAVAIGDPNVVTGTGAVGVGANNTVSGQGALGIGNQNQATGQSAVALGDSAIANGASAIAVGQGANAGVASAVAIGNGASSTGANSAAIGAGSTDGGQANVVGIGSAGQTRRLVYLAPGNVSATSTDAVNGSQLYALGTTTASAIGGGATYNATTGQITQPTYTVGGVAYNDLGSALQGATQYVQVNGANAGTAANAAGTGSIAIGQTASATGTNGTALGSNASVTNTNGTAIGNAATSTGVNSVALGAGSSDGGRANVVSVGSAQQQRAITNVAAGNVTANSTDAVNGSQLYSTNQALNNTNNAVATLQTQYGTLRRDAFSGIAGAMAMQGGQPVAPGHFSIGAGFGIYGGQSAVALRGGYTTPDGHWALGGAVSTGFASSHDIGGSVHGDYLF
jgi:autotransporter adhesin